MVFRSVDSYHDLRHHIVKNVLLTHEAHFDHVMT